MTRSRRRFLAHLALGLASLLFGVTFVVVKEAIATLPTFAFVGWRFALGALVLACIHLPRTRAVWQEGSVAGVILFAGYAFQTKGLETTTASNSGLITGLYVVMTPFVAGLVLRRRPKPWVVASAVIAFAGLAFLTLEETFVPRPGDLLTIGCAVAFAAHIVALARYAPRHHPIAFTGVQLVVVAVLSLLTSAGAEGFPLPERAVLLALVLTGVGVSAGAFLLQVWAQRAVGPGRTAIILALEPAFAAAFAALLLGERLGPRGGFGAALVLGAIFLAVTRGEPDEDMVAAEAVSDAH